MKRFKKGLTTLLTTIMLVSTAAPALAYVRQDDRLGTHWAKDSIAKWQGNGVIQGYPDGSFRPGNKVTRAELVSLVNKLFGFSAAAETSFADVPAGAWYAKDLSVAKQAGYYKGFPDNKAKADTQVTRQDAAALLAAVFSLKPSAGAASASFTDNAAISSYAKEAVQALQGTLQGYPDGSFRPDSPVTRAETVSIIDRLVSRYYHTAGTADGETVQGNVLVNHTGVILKDNVISGNLYLAPGIGSGEASLEKVTVQGDVYIAGGGEHSIHMKDAKLALVVVNRPEGKVRVTGEGATAIKRMEIESASIIETDADAVISEVVTGAGAAGTSFVGKGTISRLDVRSGPVVLNGQPLAAGTYIVKGGAASPWTAAGSTPVPSQPASTPAPDSGSGGTEPTATPSPGNGNGGTEPTATPVPSSGNGGTEPTPRVVNLADADASSATRSLFVYLDDIRGRGTLFGQQHATDEGQSITKRDGTESDVKNAVGAHPALFGWDTLSLEGKEKPGVAGDVYASIDNLAASMKHAYEAGGVLTLSAHMPNFVTGGDFYDLKGSVVSHILPGGDKHGEFNAFLDNIALFANSLKDEGGRSIPVIFRPFHEQSGSWFWWGRAFTTEDQYKELFRYTVEYLRDIKNVHNFLYAYSPGGGFGTSGQQYLETYPGDDYVDILGFDSYYNGEGQSWFDGVATEAATLSKIADAKHKIAALTEFGYQNMKVAGNSTPDFYTRLASALKSNPDAKRMAFMLTWADFTPSENSYVPYPLASGQEHQMMADFKSFFDDPYTLFSGEINGAYTQAVDTAGEQPFMHIASPANQATVTEGTTLIRVRVLNGSPAKVVYTVGESALETPLVLDPETGFYVAGWSPDAKLNGKIAAVTVKVYGEDGTVLLEQTNSVFVKISEVLLGAYTFDNGIEGVQSNGGYQAAVDSIEPGQFNGSGVLKVNASGMNPADTWQELKLELKNAKSVIDSVYLTEATRVKLDVWVPVTAQPENGNASLQAVVQLPPDWNGKYGIGTTQISFADLPKETIDGVEYVHLTPAIDMTNAAALLAADDIAVSIVGSGLASGSIPVYIDNIGLYSTYVETGSDPAVVDDFESYLGSDEALNTKFVHAGGDATETALDANKHGGSYGMKYTYTLGASGYAGVTKALNVDWSGFNALQFWYKPDAKGQKLVIQINAGGSTYEYYPDTNTEQAALVTAKFSEFVPANGATGTLTKTNLKDVQKFSIYTNAKPDGTQLTSSMYFDDIKAVNDPGAGTVPGGSDGGGTAPGTLFDFEGSLQGWTFGANTMGASGLSPATDGGKGVLSADYPLDAAAANVFDLNFVGDKDLSSGSTLKLHVRVTAGTAKGKVFLKSGADWNWANTEEVTLTDQYQWIPLDLNGFDWTGKVKIDKTMVRAIGLEIYSSDSAAIVYIDDVILE
ncbi:S-layer homology domain-containing protein [Paenibacillus sonchi]|uniref:S-layer homology domain-containing protein n=4 Tax=Paenibacillus sonchi TaxID=373687 RepID=A0A974PGR0_9BACL|nr:glycosyl hydrolase [Paenibacillus sonchi]QQZ63511.1 S-layer homology domain-containing protein [Paenibacillus sonchi]